MKTKQEYIDALERMELSYYNFDNCISAMNKFKEDINLLTELVNEHFDEKVETNFEHYKDGIIEFCIDELAISKGKVVECNAISCSECDFEDKNGHCISSREIIKWLKQPYKKPVYKLTKFEKELLQCYPDTNSFKLFNSLNGMKKKGYFKGIDDNEIIGDILEKCEVIEDRKEVIKND